MVGTAAQLATKLNVPPARAQLVVRPRLSERLEIGPQGKLTLIAAPASFGKTTLLSASSTTAAGSAGAPVVKWLASLPSAVLNARPSLWVTYVQRHTEAVGCARELGLL